MLPSLPGRRSHLARVLAGAVLVLAALLVAPAAHAFEIATVSVSRGEDGQLEVATRLTDPLEDRVQRSLDRGMPATLQLHAELWRRREGWFDRMEVGADAVLRLKYDAWNEEWRLERPGAAPIRTHSLDSLESALERPLVIAIPMNLVEKLQPGSLPPRDSEFEKPLADPHAATTDPDPERFPIEIPGIAFEAPASALEPANP